MFAAEGAAARHWFVTLTLAGEPVEPLLVRAALRRLAEHQPLLESMRFAADSAELRFWDQGTSMLDVASLALRLWDDARAEAGLPQWDVVGLEVVERAVRERRESGAAPHYECGGAAAFSSEPT